MPKYVAQVAAELANCAREESQKSQNAGNYWEALASRAINRHLQLLGLPHDDTFKAAPDYSSTREPIYIRGGDIGTHFSYAAGNFFIPPGHIGIFGKYGCDIELDPTWSPPATSERVATGRERSREKPLNLHPPKGRAKGVRNRNRT